MSADPGYRLFVQPYKTPKPLRTASYIGGEFTLSPHPTQTNRRSLEEATLVWTKTADSKDLTNRTGIDPSETVLIIDPWTKPSKTATLANLLSPPVSGEMNVASR